MDVITSGKNGQMTHNCAFEHSKIGEHHFTEAFERSICMWLYYVTSMWSECGVERTFTRNHDIDEMFGKFCISNVALVISKINKLCNKFQPGFFLRTYFFRSI